MSDLEEDLEDLKLRVAALTSLTEDLIVLLHRLDPDGLEGLIRQRRLLVQSTEAGRYESSPAGLTAHRLVRDHYERALARIEDRSTSD